MLEKIVDFFHGKTTLEIDKDGKPSESTLKVATAVLLLEMAGIDDDYAPEEVLACKSVLAKQFNLKDDDEALKILEQADSLRGEKEKIAEFVAALNTHFNVKQRQLILAMVWRVVMADEVVDKYEMRFASQVRNRLQLSKEQAEEAKRLAAEGHV